MLNRKKNFAKDVIEWINEKNEGIIDEYFAWYYFCFLSYSHLFALQKSFEDDEIFSKPIKIKHTTTILLSYKKKKIKENMKMSLLGKLSLESKKNNLDEAYVQLFYSHQVNMSIIRDETKELDFAFCSPSVRTLN